MVSRFGENAVSKMIRMWKKKRKAKVTAVNELMKGDGIVFIVIIGGGNCD